MDKILEILAAYHNEDPEAFELKKGSEYSVGKAYVEEMERIAETMPDASGHDFGELVKNILNILERDELTQLGGMLQVR